MCTEIKMSFPLGIRPTKMKFDELLSYHLVLVFVDVIEHIYNCEFL